MSLKYKQRVWETDLFVAEHLWSRATCSMGISFSPCCRYSPPDSQCFPCLQPSPPLLCPITFSVSFYSMLFQIILWLCLKMFWLLYFIPKSSHLPFLSKFRFLPVNHEHLFPHITVDLPLTIILSTSGLKIYFSSSPYFQVLSTCTLWYLMQIQAKLIYIA